MAELGFGRTAPTVPVLDGEPGQEVQLDTGWVGWVRLLTAGRRRLRAWIFTAVRSRHRFVYPCFRETTETAIEACEAAWTFFGGIFHVLIPDNTKAIVQTADALAPRLVDAFGSSMHDRIIGALETCCRQGEMLRIQNRHVDWDQQQIGIPGAHAKDKENRRIPFDPQGRLAPILKRRKDLGPAAYVFGGESGEFQESFKTAWETVLMLANGHDSKRTTHGVRVDREKLRQIDLHWHDLRHEGACRLLADGVDIRTIQLMLGHADIKQTQRYLNITDEELRKSLTGVWERRRQLRLAGQQSRPEATGEQAVGQ
jgi:hypothetical protein